MADVAGVAVVEFGASELPPEIGGGSGADSGAAAGPDGGARLIALPGGASVMGTLAGGTGAGRSPNNCARAGVKDAATAPIASTAMARKRIRCAPVRRVGVGAVTIALFTEKQANSSLVLYVSRVAIQNWHPSPSSHILLEIAAFSSDVSRFGRSRRVFGVRVLTIVDSSNGAARPTASVGLGVKRRPLIALVLGGGAARGFAHIGVIRALQARGILPDIVVGTSIGAAVGGAFVSGHLDGFESWARSLQARSVFGYLDIQLNGSGLIGGNKLAARLQEALGKTRIDDLPIKFAAVATEIKTGHEIWLTHGRLVDAIRASYALPGIFTPVLIGDRWLVDGALVNPVPVSAARALGAEIVIAVSLNSDSFGHGGTISAFGTPPEILEVEDTPAIVPRRGLRRFFSAERAMKQTSLSTQGPLPAIPTVMVEAFNIMQDRITRARLAGDPPDILISPRISGTALFDFHRAAETIEHGRRAAERAIESIEEAIGILAPKHSAANDARLDESEAAQ